MVGFSLIRVQIDGHLRFASCVLQCVRGPGINFSQRAVSRGIARIQFNCFFQVGNSIFCVVGEFASVETTLEIRFKSIRLHRTRIAQSALLFRSEPNLNFRSDRQGDTALQCQNILQIAFIRLCPKMLIGLSLDQLCIDSNSLTGASHRTFDDSPHSQFSCNFGESFARGLIAHGGSPGNDSQ